MKLVGEKLRAARIQSGLDLAALSRRTRITERYLEAIESGNTEDPPGGFFYRSFVRQYALALGVAEDEIDSELERVRRTDKPIFAAPLNPAGPPAGPEVGGSRRRWAYLALLVAALAGLLGLLRIIL